MIDSILSEDIEKLEEVLPSYSNDSYVYKKAYSLALENNKKKILEWFISKEIKLYNLDDDGLNRACTLCSIDIVKLLIAHGYNVNHKNKMVGTSTIEAALVGRNYKVIPILIESGYIIEEDGVSLREAVSEQEYIAVEMLLKYGFDVNLHKPNQVFEHNTTAIAEAVQNNDIDMVKLLLSYGADITLKDKYGIRPYNLAIKNKNVGLINLIKSIEPTSFYNMEEKKLLLQKYKVPKILIEYLKRNNRRLDLEINGEPKYIVFKNIIEINVFEWEDQIFLDLLSEVDQYEELGFLVWYPKKKCLASIDFEHDIFIELGRVNDFFKNPEIFINKLF